MSDEDATSGFQLPVKRVEGETLEERMTSNAYNQILPARYLVRDEERNIVEEPEDMFRRVARNVSQPDDEYMDREEAEEEYYDLMTNLKFMPNSPTLMNAGTEIQQLSACFLVHPEDDMSSIFETAHDAAMIHKSGGGTGYPFHTLRPKGDVVKGTGGIASGPMSFMEVYDQVCATVKQGGCLSQDSRVMTSDGYIPIGEVHNSRPNSESPSKSLIRTREGFKQAAQTHESGEMDLHTITTEEGYSFQAVYEHPVLSVNGQGELTFRRVDQIEEGDVIIYDKSDKIVDVRQKLNPVDDEKYHNNTQIADDLPEEVTDGLSRVLGILWADGTFDKSNNRLVFSLAKGRDDKDVVKETLSSWGLNVHVTDKKKTGKGDYWRVVVNSKHLIEWMKKNGLEKDVTSIPEAIYRSPASIPSFLGGFAADASVSEDAGTIVYSSAERETAKNLQELLLLCGIASKVSRCEERENRFSDKERFSVRVNPGGSARAFDEKIPHPFTREFGDNGGERQNRVHFADKLVGRLLNERFEKNNKLPDDVDRKAMKELRRYERGDRVPSRDRLVNQLAKVGIEDVPELREEHLFQVVESNEENGRAPIADIEIMNGSHEFIADNVVVHNKRRGAQMGIMRVNHPDVLRFVVSKRDEDTLTNFNISVGLTDDFMEAVKNDEEYELINPRTGEQFEVSKQTAEFYNTDEEYWPEASGSDSGRDDNFWRDYADSFENLSDYDIELEEGEPMRLPARFIWECLVDSAWVKGEPGLFMYDRANDMHSFDVDEHQEHRIEATNPCGEQPLENNEACNLGHVNLSLIVADDGDGTAYKWEDFKDAAIEQSSEEEFYANIDDNMSAYLQEALDVNEMERIARIGTRFLDNVVTMSDFPLEEIEDTVSSLRKVGLGIMGFAQMLVQLGIPYGSRASFAAARETQRLITKFSVEESHRLAEERGAFDEWERSKWAEPTEYPAWFRKYSGGKDPENFEDGYKVRNHNTTTIAPTGTTSMLGDTSGGCEPIFSLAYFKNVGKDIQGEDMLVEFDDYFLRALEANDVDVESVKDEAERLMRNNEWEGVESIPDDVLPPRVKDVFVTADQVTPEEHVRIQAAFQEHNHSGISKTCNFPNDATREDVAEAYMLAYELGCKGLTVYRDGSRETQVLTTREDNKIEEEDASDTLKKIKEEYGGVEGFLREAGDDERVVVDKSNKALSEEEYLQQQAGDDAVCETCGPDLEL